MDKLDLTKFTITNSKKIAQILESLVTEGSIVSAYFNNNSQLVTTSVIGADEGSRRLYLDLGPDPQLNQALLTAKKINFITNQQSVKVHFSSGGVQLGEYRGHKCFISAFPQDLIRLQRRNHYRIDTPRANPPLIQLIDKNGNLFRELTVLDISVGGIGVIDFNLGIRLVPQEEFPDCLLKIPDFGEIRLGVIIQSVFYTKLKNGNQAQRAGLKFTHIPSTTEATIQKYINKLEIQYKK